MMRDGQGSHGVRGRDESAENEADGQRQTDKVMQQKSDSRHRQEDQADRQEENGAEVGAKVSPGSEDGTRVNQGREKEIKDQIGFQVNGGKAWNQSEDHATDGQKDGVGDVDSPGKEGQQPNGDKTN